jgi:hypothetical protein
MPMRKQTSTMYRAHICRKRRKNITYGLLVFWKLPDMKNSHHLQQKMATTSDEKGSVRMMDEPQPHHTS